MSGVNCDYIRCEKWPINCTCTTQQTCSLSIPQEVQYIYNTTNIGLYLFICPNSPSIVISPTHSTMPCDRLVCGIHDVRVQRRLLAEPDLTFKKAYDLDQLSETADKSSKHLHQQKSGWYKTTLLGCVLLYTIGVQIA